MMLVFEEILAALCRPALVSEQRFFSLTQVYFGLEKIEFWYFVYLCTMGP